MNKQDPKFIKDAMTDYVNKVSSHHYATNDLDNRIIFYPYFGKDRCHMIIVTINEDDKISVDSRSSKVRRGFRESLFLDNKYYVKYRSIKRHKKYDNLFNGVKEYLDKQNENDFYSYGSKLKIHEGITKIINK